MRNGYRSLTLSAAALLLWACASRPGGPLKPAADSLLQPLDRIVAAMTGAVEKVPARTIVVYEFTDMSRRITPEGRLVAERLTTKLVQTGKFQMIERSRLEAAMKELNLQGSGIIDESMAVRAGRLLGAEAVITGTLARLNGKFEVNARMIDVRTGVILSGHIAALREDDLLVNDLPAQNDYRAYAAPQHPRTVTAETPALGRESSITPEGWEKWPGWDGRYGSYRLENGRLYYMLAGRQHDAFEAPRDGYYPGLLLARTVKGDNWTVDVKANYFMKPPGGRWFTLYLWFGDAKARPSASSPGSALTLAVRRNADYGYNADDTHFSWGGKEDKVLGPGLRFFRFTRKKDLFTVYASADGKAFERVSSVRSAKAAAAPAQKLVLAGQAFAETGSYAEYEYIKFNGKPLF